MDNKRKNVHDKPSKLGTYLGKKAGVSDEFELDSASILQDTEEIGEETNSENNLEEQVADGAVLSKSAPAKKEKPPKKKHSVLKKLSVLFMTLTVIAALYAGLFILAPILIIIPAAICYLIWFVIMAVVSICTVGIIWTNDGWKDFSQGFLDFNNGLWDFANHTNEFLEGTFTPTTIALGACVVASITLSAIGMSSKKFKEEKYKASMISSIVLGVVFVAFTILNIYFISTGKTVL